MTGPSGAVAIYESSWSVRLTRSQDRELNVRASAAHSVSFFTLLTRLTAYASIRDG
jgi:hypothetical protein